MVVWKFGKCVVGKVQDPILQLIEVLGVTVIA